MTTGKKYMIEGLTSDAQASFNLDPAIVGPFAEKYVADGEISKNDPVVMHGSLYPYAIKMILKYKLLPVSEVEKLAI
ncbi:hypothetical protein [Eupransor demetentiae]|uniref:Uncharacterized protein n=1 Tax=Eupransor demetentiae TaxID=3109584 RepID=A0ABP0EQB0_9LACO|nr:hypothetical protein R54876_GBNLAHCA_00890 [Lactobacillaceae bacterium LMG 33000]